jgi:hypothetical protein
VNRIILIFLGAITMFQVFAQTNSNHGRLQVSENQRFLQYEDGTPFFYLGETAWELIHRCSRDEAKMFLKNRAEKGFTVIQTVILGELDGLNVPNVYNDYPLMNNDPLKPNEAYFQHVDYIIDMAATYGLYIALLPTWGDKVVGNNAIFTIDNAEKYGKFLGKRYKDKKNIIWVLGGDRNWDGYEPIWRAMAKGITIGVAGSEDYSKTLMTLHPTGSLSSSRNFHNDAWLDFNMQQDGHCYTTDSWNKIKADYNRLPVKPVIDGEPLYEEHPICFNAVENGFSTDYHVRRYLYHDLFAGALGHTYGCHAIWQMFTKNRVPINFPRRTWIESLNLPGAFQMQYARWLIESRPFLTRIPDESLILSDTGTSNYHISATRDIQGSYVFVYSEQGNPFTIDMSKLKAKQITAWWFDPRTGNATMLESFENSGNKNFQPPTSGMGNDWVLVLDDASQKYKTPGLHTLSNAAPLQVSNLKLIDVMPTSVSLRWDNPGNPSNVNGYIVYVNGKEYGGTPSNNITINDLLPGTKYAFSVVTVANNLKESSQCPQLLATTKQGIKIKKLQLSPAALSMEVGKHEKLNLKIDPVNATVRKFDWVSSDTTIASVNSSGMVSARKTGETTINVFSSVEGIKVSVPVKVELPVDLLNVKFVKDEITLDGKLSEPCWQNQQGLTKSIVGMPNNQASFGLVWTEEYLIIGFKVIDDKLFIDSPTSPWEDDGVEIYLNIGNTKSSTTTSNDRQFIAVPGKPVWETRDKTTGVISVVIKNDDGFSGEIAIPFSNLGISPVDGTFIGFDLTNIDDDNGGNRDNVLVWKGTTANWGNTSNYGTIRLVK